MSTPPPPPAAYGAALKDALDHALATGDLEPMVRAAERCIAAGHFPLSRAELLATFTCREEFRLVFEGRPGRYFPVTTMLVEAGHCTGRDMQEALLGTLLMRGLNTGSLPAVAYDMLASLVGRDPQARAVLSRILREDAESSARPASGPGDRKKKRRRS